MSRPRKRSFTIRGHRTSLSLEEPFWDSLREIAKARGLAVAALVTEIDAARGGASLSGAIRVHCLDFYRRGGESGAPVRAGGTAA
ncbi:MAG: ribbon-helix-helix domain-containing protein [Hyphomicrobiaceae bacterium]|nr:ribbon-helix-helix domain-containing protein [Hyphomicrobiaceae bacterium]